MPLERDEIDKFAEAESFVRDNSLVSFITKEMGNHLANFFFVLVLALLGAVVSVVVRVLTKEELLPHFEADVLHFIAIVMCVCGAASIVFLSLASVVGSFNRLCEEVQHGRGLDWLRNLWAKWFK